ncbi:MAG: hypothetical protein MHPDNHAH_02859 [Anaerolineales bacterium]|nr:hypothetical protein [Anaerolineales bacterium]WKZ48802.1 MAG: endonuclease/exonuclease/phosphatase family protein [Anaerolineales bacterium]
MKHTLGCVISPNFLAPTYALVIIVWFISWITVGDANRVLVLLKRYIFWLLAVTPFLVLYSFVRHQQKSAIWLIFPSLIFLWLYNPYLLPKGALHAPNAQVIRVLTYNVLFSNENYDAVAGTILANQPDLVALQEVQPAMMDKLQKRLQAVYPHSLLGTENDYGTTAVFSRYPFMESYILDLQADRPAVIVTVEIQGKTITFVSTHLLAYNLWWTKLKDIPATVMERTFNQNRQAALLIDEIKSKDGIVILGCDCNGYETSSSYRLLDQVMDNSARSRNGLAPIDSSGELKRDVFPWHIDFVWYKGEVLPAGTYKVSNSSGSDHLPVLSTFVINPEAK